MNYSRGPDEGDIPRRHLRFGSISKRWLVLATAGFLLGNAIVITLLSGVSGARGKQSCVGFSGYSGGSECVSDLNLTNLDAPDPTTVGGHLFYLIEVQNKGPDDASNVQIDDHLPVGLQIDWIMLPESPYGFCSIQGRAVFCTFYSLSQYEKAAITIVTRPIIPGVVKNTATTSSSSRDPNPRNNKRTQQTTING